MWSLIEFGSRMDSRASKNNLRDHKGQRSTTLTLLKSNSWLFLIQCCDKREFLSHVFFCSGSQCSGCLTKFFADFTTDFIHVTSWKVLIEFVIRFLQVRTNRLDGFMSNIYVELSQISCKFFREFLKIWQRNKASVVFWLIILGLIYCFRLFGSLAAF